MTKRFARALVCTALLMLAIGVGTAAAASVHRRARPGSATRCSRTPVTAATTFSTTR